MRSRSPHILNGERGIGHFRHFLDLKVEKAECVIVKAVVDIIKDEFAALIDNDTGSFIAVGVMLHQIKAVTADFVLVNGVPRPDVSGNRQTGGIGVRRKPLSPLLRQPPERLGRGTTLKAAFNVFADA